MDRNTRHLQRAVKAQRDGVALSKGQGLSPNVASLLDGLLSFFDPMSTVPSSASSDPISSISPGDWNLLFPLNPNTETARRRAMDDTSRDI